MSGCALTNKFSTQIMFELNELSIAFVQHHLTSFSLKSIDSSWILLILLWIAFTRIPQIISILRLHRRGRQREKTTNLPPTRHTLFRKQDGRESRRKRFPHPTKAHLAPNAKMQWLSGSMTTRKTVYKVHICPRGKLSYKQIYLIIEQKSLFKGYIGVLK